jgi:hypothetical protein
MEQNRKLLIRSEKDRVSQPGLLAVRKISIYIPDQSRLSPKASHIRAAAIDTKNSISILIPHLHH